jgi:hypothetical protein
VTDWIRAMAIVETAHLAAFEQILEAKVSGPDAIYSSNDQLGVVLDTEEDEVWFRMALLCDTSIGDIHRVGEQSYVMSPRFLGEVRTQMDHRLFEGSVFPLTAVYLELAHVTALCAINDGLATAGSLFAGHPPALIAV